MEPHDATLEILDRLVAFPTVSGDSNLALIDYAEQMLRMVGFDTMRMPDPAGTKAGLAARIGPGGPGGVLLSAHSDVVPVSGQHWTHPQFRLTRDAGRLFARGSTDMKGFLASALSAGLSAARRARSLSQPLMLVISYDEEVGCRGIRQMLPLLQGLGWQPELCIVGEPTSMRPAIGHKGKAAFVATCHGSAGHSSMAPRFVNALHLAGDFLAILRRAQQEFATIGRSDQMYDIPYSTVHAGRMAGGTALNIVPDLARIEFELRHLPGDDPEAFLSRIRADVDALLSESYPAASPARIEVEMVNNYPGLNVATDDPALARMIGLCGSDRILKVAFGTEAGYFAELGIPTLVCGPGDMEGQGHKADEFLQVDQLGACDAMMDRLLDQLSRAA